MIQTLHSEIHLHGAAHSVRKLPTSSTYKLTLIICNENKCGSSINTTG